jgi:hypothetical protein
MTQGNRHREHFIRVIYESPILAKHGPLPHLAIGKTKIVFPESGDRVGRPTACIFRRESSQVGSGCRQEGYLLVYVEE